MSSGWAATTIARSQSSGIAGIAIVPVLYLGLVELLEIASIAPWAILLGRPPER
jgi:hypothetical protein